jgi:hypothetical protein
MLFLDLTALFRAHETTVNGRKELPSNFPPISIYILSRVVTWVISIIAKEIQERRWKLEKK